MRAVQEHNNHARHFLFEVFMSVEKINLIHRLPKRNHFATQDSDPLTTETIL